MKTSHFFSVGLALCALLAPAAAQAQASRSGNTFAMGGTPLVVTPDVAYDSAHDQFLVVHGHGFIEGLLTNGSGVVLKSLVINADAPAGIYAQTPRVAYSPDVNGGAGGYLVTWHSSVSSLFAQVHARLVSADGTPLGASDLVLSTDAVGAGLGSFWTMGAAVAYSTASKEFLVAWMGHYTSTNDIFFNRVGADGTVLQALPTLVTAGTPDWERDPAVAYNPDLNEFYVAYAGFWDGLGYGYISGARITAGTGVIAAHSPEFGATVSTLIPAVAYSTLTKQYTVGWNNTTRASRAMYGINVNGDGTAASAVRVLSAYYQAYDALDIKFNQSTGNMLLTTHGAAPQNWEDACVSIQSDGTPYDNGFICTNTPDVRPLVANPSQNDGNFNPRLAVTTASGRWLLVTSSIFKSVNAQFVAGGAGGTTPPPPPPPTVRVTGLSANTTFPVVQGTTVQWTATASGGTAPLQYQFWEWKPGPGWFLYRDFTSSNTAGIPVGFGPYQVRVVVKDANNSTGSLDSAAFQGLRTAALTVSNGGAVGGALVLNTAAGQLTPVTGSGAAPAANTILTLPSAKIYPGDFNGDGLTDFIEYDPATGQMVKAINNGDGTYTQYPVVNWAPGWTLTVVDFDNDGYDDLFLYNPTNGLWWRFMSTGFELLPTEHGTWAPGWTITVGDFNGDGYPDFFLYNKNFPPDMNSGKWFRVMFTPATGFTYVAGDLRWAPNWEVHAADFDGDGKTDLFLYGPDGSWFQVFFTATGATYAGPSSGAGPKWAAGWTIVAGDFTGDHHTDLWLYNSTTGRTVLAVSTGGVGFTYFEGPKWAAGWQLIPTDFNGDGITDLLLYNPSTGAMYQETMLGTAIISSTVAPGGVGAGMTVIGSSR